MKLLEKTLNVTVIFLVQTSFWFSNYRINSVLVLKRFFPGFSISPKHDFVWFLSLSLS